MAELTAEVSIYFRIVDPAALVAAGRRYLIEHGIAGDDETAAEIIEDDDYSQALRYLVDPGGEAPAGTEVLDSACELVGTMA